MTSYRFDNNFVSFWILQSILQFVIFEMIFRLFETYCLWQGAQLLYSLWSEFGMLCYETTVFLFWSNSVEFYNYGNCICLFVWMRKMRFSSKMMEKNMYCEISLSFLFLHFTWFKGNLNDHVDIFGFKGGKKLIRKLVWFCETRELLCLYFNLLRKEVVVRRKW